MVKRRKTLHTLFGERPRKVPVGTSPIAHTLRFLNWQCDMDWRGLSLAPSRLLTRGSVLSLCLFALLTVDARPAWATCGDYLHGHSSSSMGEHGLGQPMTMNSLLHSQSQPAGGSRPACSGPHCQRDQQTPAAPGKAVQTPQFSDAILVAISALTVADDLSGCQAADVDHVQGPVGRVFRPPRVTCG